MPTLTLSDLTQDFTQFQTQFNTYLANNPVWKGELTTMTSITLIELVSSVGTFNQGRITRAYEDAFSETAQSDDAIRAITQMQGLRMSRKLSAQLQATIQAPLNMTLNPLTQFIIGGQYYYNRSQIFLSANDPQTVYLNQGQIQTYIMNGLGTDRQTFLSEEDAFTVSDQDAKVFLNNVELPKSFGTLWNFKSVPGYADLTTNDGRLLIVFGSKQFGSVPLITDTVVVQYPITQGADGSSQVLLNRSVSVDGFSDITGVVVTNPTGGGDEQPIQTYKNLSSGAFGTYSSAVTKSQYSATVGVYPGIIDSVTQAQREINPMKLDWMNVIRVSALTTAPWTQIQKDNYLKYLQTVTMYAPRYVWQDAIAMPRDVKVDVYCFNPSDLNQVKADCETSITALFSPRPGLLMTNFYDYDIANECRKAARGAMSYAIVKEPTDPMIVTLPQSPQPVFEIISGAGTLGQSVYAYAVSTVSLSGEEGTPSNWVFPQITDTNSVYGIRISWNDIPNTAFYKVWGRVGGHIGLLSHQIPTLPRSFLDDGSIVPAGDPPNLIAEVPIRYNSLNSLEVNVYYAERQQRLDGSIPTREQ